jgi:transposase
VPPEKVDKIIEYRSEVCPHCQNILLESTGEHVPCLERHQVWELPEIRPSITEHRLVAGWCPCCQVWVKPDLPAAVGRSAFGPRLQDWVAILTGRFRQSRRQVRELLWELCGVNVSLESVQTLCEETSEALAAPYQEVNEAVTQADIA